MTELDRRLKNVQQADLTESRVNDDFVLWLKTWGQNILLVVLTVAALAMAWHWWGQRKERERDAAWGELGAASLPAALKEIAARHEGTDAIALMAQLEAAGAYLTSVVTDRRFDREAGAADASLTPEQRAEWLKEADALYAAVAARTAGESSLGGMGFHVTALWGRAAVAEDAGDLKAAEGYLREIETKTKGTPLANAGEVAASRIASLPALSTTVQFAPKPPPPAVVPSPAPGAQAEGQGFSLTPVSKEEVMKALQGGAPGTPAPATGPIPAPTPASP